MGSDQELAGIGAELSAALSRAVGCEITLSDEQLIAGVVVFGGWEREVLMSKVCRHLSERWTRTKTGIEDDDDTLVCGSVRVFFGVILFQRVPLILDVRRRPLSAVELSDDDLLNLADVVMVGA